MTTTENTIEQQAAAAEHTFEVGAFDIFVPGGHVYRIWSNGRIEGFPPNAWIFNGIIPEMKRAVAEALEEERKEREDSCDYDECLDGR